MQTKLTLRLDEELIDDAKRYAAMHGRSLSQLVADYFSALAGPRTTVAPGFDGPASPLTDSLLGLLCMDDAGAGGPEEARRPHAHGEIR